MKRLSNKLLGTSLFVAAASLAQANFVLEGDFLRVGVHTSGGLIDDGFNTGITYDPTGTGTFSALDFLKPGIPFEFYSIGFGGGYYNYGGYAQGNNFAASTVNTSVGSTLSTRTTGSWAGLSFVQDMWFGASSGLINFSVQLTNTSGAAVSDVIYARGLDPDQDSYVYGSSDTTNTVVSNNLVTARGPYSDWTIGIFSDSAITHTPSVRQDWSSYPEDLVNPVVDSYGDSTINMAWEIGTLADGESTTITFQYRIAETHGAVVTPGVPDAASTLGLLSLALGVVAFLRRKR